MTGDQAGKNHAKGKIAMAMVVLGSIVLLGLADRNEERPGLPGLSNIVAIALYLVHVFLVFYFLYCERKQKPVPGLKIKQAFAGIPVIIICLFLISRFF